MGCCSARRTSELGKELRSLHEVAVIKEEEFRRKQETMKVHHQQMMEKARSESKEFAQQVSEAEAEAEAEAEEEAVCDRADLSVSGVVCVRVCGLVCTCV